MIQKKSKIAQAHVEIILSFIIFIGALMFIFIFLNPFAKTEEKDSVSEKTYKIIMDKMSSEIGKLSVIGSLGAGTYDFPAEYGNHFIEVQETANPLKCNLYFSYSDFNQGTKNCKFNTYELGVYSKEKMLVWDKIVLLKQNYEENYDDLKSDLGISDDFIFNFNNIDGEEVSELGVSKNIPIGINVQSENIPVRVIDNSGVIHELILNVRVW